MLETTGDLFSSGAQALLIPTNGIVKKNGDAVMGAGVAKIAAQKFPYLPSWLGRCLPIFGNVPLIFGVKDDPAIITFPTKNHWSAPSSLELIEQSAKRVVEYVNDYHLESVALPAVGCGLGGLDWKVVKPVLEKYFDDRYTVYHQADSAQKVLQR